MMKKHFCSLLLIGAAVFLTACSGGEKQEAPVIITLYTWPDYFPRDVIRQFESEFGIRVRIETYLTNEALMAEIEKGRRADVILPSDFMVAIMKRKQLLAPLDKKLLPNLKYLEPRFQNPAWDKQGEVAIPYFYGMTGIAYTDKVDPQAAESWSVLFDPKKLEPFRGKVSMLDNKREALGSALIYLGQSPNTLDPEALRQAAQLLVEQKPFLKGYDSQQYIEQLEAGALDIAQAWSGDAIRANIERGKVSFSAPDEGVIVFIDAFCIPAASKHRKAAHQLINFFMRPDIAAQLTEFSYFATTNTGAQALLPDPIRYGPAYDLPEKTYTIEDVGAKTDSAYEHYWQSVK